MFALSFIGGAGNSANGEDSSFERNLIGSSVTNNWNYKETITSTFNLNTSVCQVCTKSQKCSKTKNPWFGNKHCQKWADPVESCKDVQF